MTDIQSFLDERHGPQMDGATRAGLHQTMGARWIDGLGLTGLTVDGDGSDDAHAQFGVADGAGRDEDIVVAIADGAPTTMDPVLVTSQLLHRFTLGGGNWSRADSDGAGPFPIQIDGLPVSWNRDTAGTWEIIALTDGQLTYVHVFGLNSVQDGGITDDKIALVMGQQVFDSIDEAREEAEEAMGKLDFAGFPAEELIPLATVIVQYDSAYTNAANARIVSTGEGYDYVDHRRLTPDGGAGSQGLTVARALRETGGPTTLPIGAIADGQVLKRVGAAVVGVSGGGDVVGPAGATDNAIARWNTATGKLLQDSLLKILDTGELDMTGHELRNRAFNTISPAAIAAQQNDYSPAGWANAERVRLDLTGNQTITGFVAVAPTAGAVLKIIHNTDAVDSLTIAHESTASAAANRVLGAGGVGVVLAPLASAVLLYDATSARWRVVAVSRPQPLTAVFWGGASMGGGDAGKHFQAHDGTGGGKSATLSEDNQMAAPFAGRGSILTWSSATADGTTVLKMLVAGAVVETVTLTGVAGALPLTTTPFAKGGLLAVEYDAGTAPGGTTVQVWARRTGL